jgi:hypothetical protein
MLLANLLFKTKQVIKKLKEGSSMQKSRTTAINKILSIILLVTLLMTLITVVLVMSSKPSAIFPSTNSQSAQDNEASAFMSKVTGLDMAQYNMLPIYSYPGNGSFEPEMITYDLSTASSLSAGENKVDAFCQFRNGVLVYCKLNPITGSPLFANAPSTDQITAAKNILQRLQSYYANSYLPAMNDMLNFTMNQDQSENFLISKGNLTLAITMENNIDNFEWSYTPNGMSDTYIVVILTTENGNFQSFSDV